MPNFETPPLNLHGQPPGSKIMDLIQLGGMTFSITNNAGWYDLLIFPDPADTSQPLDISGINFHSELRSSINDPSNLLDISSLNYPPSFIVGGTNGNLVFSVDVTLVKRIAAGTYVMDMLAIDTASGMVRNLCEKELIIVTVNQGVTR